MLTNFIKMHGLGNDYIFFDLFKEQFPEENARLLAQKLSDRHFSIGGDGIVLIKPPQQKKNDAQMRIFNADGSEAEMCGNAMRCLAKYLFENHFPQKNLLKIETLAGIMLPAKVLDEKNNFKTIQVNLGVPVIEKIKLEILVENQKFLATTVSMGNPHCVIFVDNVNNFPVQKIGSIIENRTDLFPQRTNMEFVEVINSSELKMRVWERGSGETLACGTGAAAAMAAAQINNFINKPATIHLLGGDLQVKWDGKGNPLYQTGPATISFYGQVEITDYLC